MANPDCTPAVYASLDALLAAATRVAAPDALLDSLRWALTLRRAALQVRQTLNPKPLQTPTKIS